MTGLERNADIVHMATYAPLLAHVEGWQWRPDMIWYDNLRSFKSVSYYVQQLYSHYKGSNVLQLTMNGVPVSGQEGQDGLFASAVYDKALNAVIVKVANTSDQPQQLNFQWNGHRRDKKFASAEVITLHTDDMNAENTLAQPEQIIPVTAAIDPSALTEEGFKGEIPGKTFNVYIFKR